MPGHAGRCVKITCNFTHPSAQTGNRVYPSASYTYSYEADNVAVRRDIEKHAKRKYAAENRIRQMWIGFIQTSDQIRNNARSDSDLHERVDLIP
jgi:hypothetical protein